MKPQLFLLHYAGGNCYSFQFMMPMLTPFFDVVPTELPGRGKRIMEPLVNSKDEAILELAMVIKNQLNGQPYMTYGHSMGAMLTPFIVNILKRVATPPIGVVVSGNPSPVVPDGINRHQMSQADLAEELRYMGGIPEEYFSSPELIAFFEPIVRSDFKIAESRMPAEQIPVIDVPVYSIMGTEEVFSEKIADWAAFTTGEFGSELMEGGHFFIQSHPDKIADRIKKCYDRYMVLQNG
jgi:external thioesterase TEII